MRQVKYSFNRDSYKIQRDSYKGTTVVDINYKALTSALFTYNIICNLCYQESVLKETTVSDASNSVAEVIKVNNTN